jgi:membrane protease YdiL (CAAX protease family)
MSTMVDFCINKRGIKMSRYQKIDDRKYRKEESVYQKGRSFTQVGIIMAVIAVFGLFIIGIRHFDTWGKINILEGFFALFGLVGLDFIKTREFNFGKPYKKFEMYTVGRFILILAFVVIIQFFSQIAFTIENVELALTIVFASIAEEIFFRAVLISIFLEIDEKIRPFDQKKIIDIPVFGKTNLNIRVFGIAGIIVSSLFFAGIHTNYYDNPAMLLAVFLGGLAFGVFYYIWEDLLACILAHFIMNIIAVWQSGLLVNLTGSYSLFALSLTLILFIFIIIFIISRKYKKNGVKISILSNY